MSLIEVARHIAEYSYCAVPDFVSFATWRALAEDCRNELARGRFRPAAVGRAGHRQERPAIRRDRIEWWEPSALRPSQALLWAHWEGLRLAVNRELMLGAWSLEAHYAEYQPGGYYGRHLDRFADDDLRVLSLVLYLNEDWRDSDGGALRLHLDQPVSVLPRGGTLIAFLSDRVPHEVEPTARERLSVAGWFRRRDPSSTMGG